MKTARVVSTFIANGQTLQAGRVVNLKAEALLALGELVEVIEPNSEPSWHYDFCLAHADFNNWRGNCPCSIDDCLISRIIDCGGDIDKVRGIEIGHGLTTDMVIDEWLGSSEPIEDLFKSPTWFVCMAEHLKKGSI